MNLRRLESFVLVAQGESVTGAARRLGFAQSSLSGHLCALEDDLGCSLFLREGRGLRLTEEGRSFLPFALRILALAEKARRTLDGRAPDRADLHLGIQESFAPRLLPPVLRALRRARPRASLRVHQAIPATLRDWVRGEILDAAVLLDLPEEAPQLKVESLRWEPTVFAASPDHPLASRPALLPSDLLRSDLLVSEEGAPGRRALDSLRSQLGISPGGTVIQGLEGLVACLHKGLGFALIPRFFVGEELAEGHLAALRWQGPIVPCCLQLITREDRGESGNLKELLLILRRFRRDRDRKPLSKHRPADTVTDP